MPNPLLHVNRKELALAGSILKKVVRPSQGLEVVLAFDGKELQLEVGGGGATATAHGSWSGSARVDSRVLLNALSRMPGEKWVKLEVVEGVLKVGSLSVPCIWRPGEVRSIWVPVNPRIADYVAIRMYYSDEAILGAGLWEKVEGALAERDRLVASAANTLAPLAVGLAELAAFVNETIRQGFDPEEVSGTGG